MRRRLMLSIAGVATAAILLFALPLAILVQRNYRSNELLRLQRDTTAATRIVDVDPSGRDPVELPPSSDRLAVYDPSGRRVAGSGPARAHTVARGALRADSPADHAADGQLVTALPLLSAERVTGALRAQRSDDAASAETHRAWLLLVGLAALV